jgi:GDPmannose 4,6-dehydratase
VKALILGASGQDGRLLAAELTHRAHHVIGIDRAADPAAGIEALDLRDLQSLAAFLNSQQPNLIFHLAAIHGAAGSQYEAQWPDMLAINVVSVHTVLEYLRTQRTDARLIYASSIKVFGASPPELIDDDTPMKPGCLYGITKQTATEAIGYYRARHGVCATAIHFGNHESWLRPPAFFIPTLLSILARALGSTSFVGELGTLDFSCDWGSAAEYMGLAAAIAESRDHQENFVIGTGKCVFARELAERLFRRFGLDYRRHIRETAPAKAVRPASYRIECGNLMKRIGRLPQIGIDEVCFEILERNYGIANPQESRT